MATHDDSMNQNYKFDFEQMKKLTMGLLAQKKSTNLTIRAIYQRIATWRKEGETLSTLSKKLP